MLRGKYNLYEMFTFPFSSISIFTRCSYGLKEGQSKVSSILQNMCSYVLRSGEKDLEGVLSGSTTWEDRTEIVVSPVYERGMMKKLGE